MSKNRVGTIDEQIEEVLCELRLHAFVAVKEISVLRGLTCGEMECPMCGQLLLFSTAQSNGHVAAHCTREGCLSCME